MARPYKPEARPVKDLQLGLYSAQAASPGLLHMYIGRGQNSSPIKLELSENSTTCWSSASWTRTNLRMDGQTDRQGGPYHQSAFLSDSDIMRMLLTTISRRWCKKLPNWLSQSTGYGWALRSSYLRESEWNWPLSLHTQQLNPIVFMNFTRFFL